MLSIRNSLKYEYIDKLKIKGTEKDFPKSGSGWSYNTYSFLYQLDLSGAALPSLRLRWLFISKAQIVKAGLGSYSLEAGTSTQNPALDVCVPRGWPSCGLGGEGVVRKVAGMWEGHRGVNKACRFFLRLKLFCFLVWAYCCQLIGHWRKLIQDRTRVLLTWRGLAHSLL